MLEQIDTNIWSIPSPLKLFGLLQLNTRMTIIRLQNGDLWLHSLIPITPKLKEEIDTLGTVRYLVAPSCLHHLFIGQWMEAYPAAKSYAAKGLKKKRPELQFSSSLGAVFQADWLKEIKRLHIDGMPMVNESLFYHQASQTLIATDFFFYMPQASGFTSFYATINGFKSKMACPIVFRFAIKYKDIFRQSLKPLRDWPVSNISMCHHAILNEDAQDSLNKVLDGFKI
jgi:hypothetical protein